MLERVIDFFRGIWARITKQPKSPEYQPIESLDTHLRDNRRYATENYGVIRPMPSFGDMRRKLAVVDRYLDVEMIGVKRTREYQPVVATNILGDQLAWSRYLDTCHGWEQHQELARNGVDALKYIIDAIDLVKLEKPFGPKAEWHAVSWTLEASARPGWFHYHVVLIQKGQLGSFTTATLHFFVTDIHDVLVPT